MAYAIVHTFRAGTKEQYEAALAAVHPSRNALQRADLHAAGASPGGWTIVAIHETVKLGAVPRWLRCCGARQGHPGKLHGRCRK